MTKPVIIILLAALWGFIPNTNAQTKTTAELHEKFDDILSLYFYKNTLRMLNQSENKGFDEIIKDIDKMKFLMIDKPSHHFEAVDYQKLLTSYKSEHYEEIMTSRFNGKHFDIFLKEKDGHTKGMVVLANDSSNLYVLDILGKVALNKVTELFSTIDNSAEIGKMIKAFTDGSTGRDRSKRGADKN